MEHVVLHCTGTGPGEDIGRDELYRKHVAAGGADCGYHFVIRRDGKVEVGTPLPAWSVHAGTELNGKTVSVCIVGSQDNYTEAQYRSLSDTCRFLRLIYWNAEVTQVGDITRYCTTHPGLDLKAHDLN